MTPKSDLQGSTQVLKLILRRKMDKEKKEYEAEQVFNLSTGTNPAREFWEFVVDLLKTGIIVFVVAFLLRYFVIQPYIVDGDSMKPNFHNNEYLLAEKISYLVGEPDRGDVVIFRFPKNPSLNYIKRIIALPGERVKIENNEVIIYNDQFPNGKVIEENYIPDDFETEPLNGKSVLEETIRSDEYFVMGDNRSHSSDSREWGILPKANLLGRAWLTLFPFKEASFHQSATYPELSGLVDSLSKR